MARGTLVGDAYVRLLVDGTFLKRAVKDELKKSGDDVDAEGKKLGKDFGRAIKAGSEEEVRNFNRDLARALGQNKPAFDKFRQQGQSVDDTMKALTDRVRLFYDRQRLSEKDMKVAENAINKWGKSVKAVELDKLSYDMDKVHTSALRMNSAFDQKQTAKIQQAAERVRAAALANDKMRESALRMNTAFDASTRAYERQMAALEVNKINQFTKAIRKLAETQAKAAEKSRVAQIKEEGRAYESNVSAIKRLEPALMRLVKPLDGIGKGGRLSAQVVKDMAVEFDRSGGRAARMSAGVERASGAIAKGFGKGSRNNFLNVVGSMAGGFTQLAKAPIAIGDAVFNAGKELKQFTTVFSLVRGQGGGFLEAFKGGASGATDAFKSMGKSGVGAIAAVIAAAVGLPAIVSSIALLAGGITAVLGAVGFGLAGALLPIIPLLVGVGTAVAVMVVGMKALTASTDAAVVKGFKPFRDALDALKGYVEEDFAPKIGKSLALLGPTFKNNVVPAVKGIGDALTGVVGRFGTLMSSPSVTGFIGMWGKSLPRQVAAFGDAVSYTLSGVLAFFTPILPYAEKLANGFRNMAKSFSDWASSASGQSSITDFMKQAWERATELGGVIKEVGRFIGVVFAGGQEQGGSFLRVVRDLFQGWSDFLSTTDGQAQMKQFFVDAKNFGKTLFGVLGDLAGAFTQLVTPESIADAEFFFKALKVGFAGLKFSLGLLNDVRKFLGTMWQGASDGMSEFFGGVKDGINFFQEAWAGASDAVSSFYNGSIIPMAQGTAGALAGMVDNIVGVLRAMSNLPGGEKFGEWADGLAGVSDKIRATATGLKELPTDNLVKIKFENDVFEKLPALYSKLDDLSKKKVVVGAKDEITPALKIARDQLALLKGKDVPVSLKGEANKQAAELQTKINALQGKQLDIQLKSTGTDIGSVVAKLDGLKGKTIDVNTSGTALKDIQAAQAAVTRLRGKDIPVELRGAALAKADEIEKKIGGLTGKEVPVTAADKTGVGVSSAQAQLNSIIDTNATITAQNLTGPAVTAAGGMLGGIKDKTASIFAANKAAPTVNIAGQLIQSIKDKTASIYAANKSNPGVSSARSLIQGVKDKTASILAANKTAGPVGAARGMIQGVANKTASIFANNSTGPGVGGARAAINSIGNKTVDIFVNVASNVASAVASIRGAIASIGASIGFARGGIIAGASRVLVGEAGPEAIVPLNRPLSQVDPAVRMLSAIAQGKVSPKAAMAGPARSSGGSIEAGAIVVQGSLNPMRTAEAVIDRMALAGYIG